MHLEGKLENSINDKIALSFVKIFYFLEPLLSLIIFTLNIDDLF